MIEEGKTSSGGSNPPPTTSKPIIPLMGIRQQSKLSRDISLLEAMQICTRALERMPLSDDYLEIMVSVFDGRTREEHWKDFREKYDMNDPYTQGVLQCCKMFKYLDEKNNE